MNLILISLRNAFFTGLLISYTGIASAQTTTASINDPEKTDSIQVTDTLSKFDRFNKKAEALFKIIPVPIISYSSDAGNVFGLAKFNLFELYKNDTITKPTKLSEVVTFSTKGRVNVSVATELVLKENRTIILGYVNYKKQPEYFFGIGNNVTKENVEQLDYSRFKFFATSLFLLPKSKKFYVGVPLDVSSYFNVKLDSNSYVIRNDIIGKDGGFSLGTGLALSYDNRDNRYNPSKGGFLLGSFLWYPRFLGSSFEYTRFDLDARTYFNPWLKHIIAIQATTTATSGNVPFYDLAMMGGDNKMRGYYLGAFRDKVLVDAQLEYRMPVWNIFGLTGWIAAGRVAPGYGNLSFEGTRFSYGGGLRVRVDSKHNTNLRVDFGFGPKGISGTYISFAEAF